MRLIRPTLSPARLKTSRRLTDAGARLATAVLVVSLLNCGGLGCGGEGTSEPAPLADSWRPAGPPSSQPSSSPQAQSSPSAASHELSGESTLGEWKTASATDRSRVAVLLAKKQLPPNVNHLDLATAAMEITGCLSATATDQRFLAWKVAPTALTCLTAPEQERESPDSGPK